MKITLTEHGRTLIKSMKEEQFLTTYPLPNSHDKTKINAFRSLKLPSIPIEVKSPHIRISDEFSHRVK